MLIPVSCSVSFHVSFPVSLPVWRTCIHKLESPLGDEHARSNAGFLPLMTCTLSEMAAKQVKVLHMQSLSGGQETGSV